MKKFFILAVLTVFGFSNAFAEEVSDYTFQDWGAIGIKVDKMTEEDVSDFELADPAWTYYFVTIALRALDGNSIKWIDGKVEIDSDVFSLDEPEKQILDWDVFTNPDESGYNPETGFISYSATTDAPYDQTDPSDAFAFIVKVKDDNVLDTTDITISDETFKIYSPDDELTNLFTGTLTKEITELPVAEAEEVIVEEPVIEEVTETGAVEEPELIKEDVEEPETGLATNIALAFVVLMMLGFSLISIRKED